MASKAARALRKRMTPQEVKLWVKLRELRELGFHFRRQSPVLTYVVDFECRRLKLIVEVDGGQHGLARGQRQDSGRDRLLQKAGYRVLRFWNNEIDRELEGVLETILAVLEQRHPTRLAPNDVRREPPSPEGEG
jgi:very-short-patch-repair endonuclease